MIEGLQKYIDIEKSAITEMSDFLNESHLKAIEAIENCKGKVVFMSVGKGSHIGKKLAATFSSLGIPSFFVHATESCHGDLGMIEKDDIVILMSNSGKTAEVLQNIEPLHRNGIKIIGFTGGEDSELAKKSDYLLLVPKAKEADELNLAPTASSTITLVLGDSIACYISSKKGFKKQDFYKYHPNGALGASLKEESKKWEE